MFTIDFSNKTHHFLKKEDVTLVKRIFEKVNTLRNDPVPHSSVRVVGEERTFRIRLGDYRVLYEVDWDGKIILIANIDKRPKAYD